MIDHIAHITLLLMVSGHPNWWGCSEGRSATPQGRACFLLGLGRPLLQDYQLWRPGHHPGKSFVSTIISTFPLALWLTIFYFALDVLFVSYQHFLCNCNWQHPFNRSTPTCATATLRTAWTPSTGLTRTSTASKTVNIHKHTRLKLALDITSDVEQMAQIDKIRTIYWS